MTEAANEIEVIDRADGAAGSWCIRKIVPGNTAWYWNKGKWTAFAQVFKNDKETADWIAKAEAALAQKTRECELLEATIAGMHKNDEAQEAQVEQLERQLAEARDAGMTTAKLLRDALDALQHCNEEKVQLGRQVAEMKRADNGSR